MIKRIIPYTTLIAIMLFLFIPSSVQDNTCVDLTYNNGWDIPANLVYSHSFHNIEVYTSAWYVEYYHHDKPYTVYFIYDSFVPDWRNSGDGNPHPREIVVCR